MTKRKLFTSLLLFLILIAAQVTPALAAPARQDVPPTATPTASLEGTITAIEIQTDGITGESVVIVTLLDTAGIEQTILLSVDDAVALGLVTIDPATFEPVIVDTTLNQPIIIDPALVIVPVEEEGQNPVGALIASFFGTQYATIQGMFDDGAGYGVIAQSCFMSYQLAGDASMCDDIVSAKQSGDFSALTLPDGSTAENWGQFKKAVSTHKGAWATLGSIVSGHADQPGTNDEAASTKQDAKNKHENAGETKDKDNGKSNKPEKPAKPEKPDKGKGQTK